MAASAPIVKFTSEEVFEAGLQYAATSTCASHRSYNEKLRQFRAWFGSKPHVLAKIFEDLQTTTIDEARMKLREKDLIPFLMTHYFLYCYSKEEITAKIFDYCKPTLRKWCWKFIMNMAALKDEKILWPNEWNDSQHSAINLYTVDGVHCRIPEPKHDKYNKNRKYYSHKFKTAGVNYELVIDIWQSRLAWIRGPIRAGKGDAEVFEEQLKTKVPPGKRGIADKGYQKHKDVLAMPNSQDPKELRKFKGRARARHESFNGRIKNFACLKQEFRHGLKKHELVFVAVCVIVQYQMDLGQPLFDV